MIGRRLRIGRSPRLHLSCVEDLKSGGEKGRESRACLIGQGLETDMFILQPDEFLPGLFHLACGHGELFHPRGRRTESEIGIAADALTHPIRIVRRGEEVLVRSFSLRTVTLELRFEPMHLGE